MSVSSVGSFSGNLPLSNIGQPRTHATDAVSGTNTLSGSARTTDIKTLYRHYVEVFGNTSETGMVKIEKNLRSQLNAVLSKVSPGRTYDFPLDVAKILAECPLPAENVCKNGNLAYKFYVQKIVQELNKFHEILACAKENLNKLQTIVTQEDFEAQIVNELLTNLSIAEAESKRIRKEFAEYKVPKNLAIVYEDFYKYNNEFRRVTTAKSDPSSASGNEQYTQPEIKELDLLTDNKDDLSRIPDDVSTIVQLRTLPTSKGSYTRTVTTCYYQKGTQNLTDRYDLTADIRYKVEDKPVKEETTDIAFFDELPLLDKLKYIAIYYKDSTKDATRYLFPNDTASGFPCLPCKAETGIDDVTRQDKKYTADIKEIGQLEPFYIGYLVDRDGPVNALASFMEVKSAALIDQIKLLGYRIKALKQYLHFLNRGLEEINKSQSAGNARIPNAAYEILAMVASNPQRLLKSMTINGVTKDYFVLQWNGITGNVATHESPNGNYLLVPADDAGIDAFIEYGNKLDYCYDHLFDSTKGIYTQTNEEAEQKLIDFKLMTDEFRNERKKRNQNLENVAISYQESYNVSNSVYRLKVHGDYQWVYYDSGRRDVRWDMHDNTTFYDCPLYLMKEPDESKLPRELETPRINITETVNKKSWNYTWNNYYYDKSYDFAWDAIVKNFKTGYDTAVNNAKTALESINQSVESLRNKINTFDTASSNWRNKAYNIYNKILGKIE